MFQKAWRDCQSQVGLLFIFLLIDFWTTFEDFIGGRKSLETVSEVEKKD